jgi:hypothetical protein
MGEHLSRPLYKHCLERGEKLLETYRAYLVHQREQLSLLSQSFGIDLSPTFEKERLGLQWWTERRGDLGEGERLILQHARDAWDKGLTLSEWEELDELKRKIKLARLLGSEAIECLREAILPDFGTAFDDLDEDRVAPGAPDLFLWHPNPAYNLWFFAEVKGPGDSLRKNQSGWIRGHWEHIRGHVMIVHVDEGQ